MGINQYGEIGQFPYVVVGSGFFGLTIAEQIANRLNQPVLILERRNHLGGNAYSYFDEETGIEIHKYGSHIFHTSNEMVWQYVNRFTSFNRYIHKVKIKSNAQVFSMPINLHTINQFLGQDLSPIEARHWVDQQVEKSDSKSIHESLEEKAISLVGRDLYEKFFLGYTQKQWQTDPKLLPAEIISRLPLRFNYDDRYFDDVHQGLPSEGYTKWMEKMIIHPKIALATGVDFFQVRDQISKVQKVIYTGPVDQYFNYSKGHLSWRTLDLEVQKLGTGDFQGTSVMNYGDLKVPFTRIHEFKHLHPERAHNLDQTIIMKEYSRRSEILDEPYYPVNSSEDKKMLSEYRNMQINESNVYFGGRLGRYQYLDMHMAIASALKLADRIINLDE